MSLAYDRRFQARSEVVRLAIRSASPVSARHERLYIAVEQSVWASVKKGEAQAFKKVVNLVSESREASANQTRGVRLVIGMDCKRRMQRFEVEDVDGPNKGGADDLDAALAEARGRGE